MTNTSSKRRGLLLLGIVFLFLCLSLFAVSPKNTVAVSNLKIMGGTYTGSTVRGRFEGQGSFTKNGDSYEGTWKNGRFDGQGTFRAKEGWTLQGKFQQGRPLAQSILTTKEGEKWKREANGNWTKEGEKPAPSAPTK